MLTMEACVCGPWKHEAVLIGTTFPLMSSLTQGSLLYLVTPPASKSCFWFTIGTKR